MSYFKCFKMSSSLTIETCAPVGFYVLWYVLIHEQEVSAWSRDVLLVTVETRLTVCLYDTVCPYLHRRLAFKLASRLLAIIHSLTTLLDRMAYVIKSCFATVTVGFQSCHTYNRCNTWFPVPQALSANNTQKLRCTGTHHNIKDNNFFLQRFFVSPQWWLKNNT